ncbi:MAG: CbiX/SirB N-terminal domain-containing protein [Deltaproteobacteria bacterium]|nr:CbiX/SirB N-terminal domain-containing protein [Deltaproteobacteria bacterium]
MRSLLIIAHGSPRQEANEEFIQLVQKVRNQVLDTIVQHAFLDCAKPDIPHGIDLLEKNGTKEITILPFFLVHGQHTAQDIPRIVNDKKKAYPDLNFKILEPIGAWPGMTDLILTFTSVKSPLPPFFKGGKT